MKLENLDLNLLVALDALLQERSVTRAAARLNLTQPTMSHSLGRLRRHFHDELLYRAGNAYDLTPLALHLASRTTAALDGVQRIFAVQPNMDPASSTRQFMLMCSDYAASVIGPALSSALVREAPHTSVTFRFGDPSPFANDDDRLRDIDGLILPHGFLRGLPHLDLFRDRLACLVSADNNTVGSSLTLADLARMPWVSPFSSSVASTAALQQIRQLGIQVNVQVTVSGFVPLHRFIAGTDRICVIPHRMAALIPAEAGVRVLECPFDAPPLVEALWWHPIYEHDPEHVWMRRMLAGTVTGWAGLELRSA